MNDNINNTNLFWTCCISLPPSPSLSDNDNGQYNQWHQNNNINNITNPWKHLPVLRILSGPLTDSASQGDNYKSLNNGQRELPFLATKRQDTRWWNYDDQDIALAVLLSWWMVARRRYCLLKWYFCSDTHGRCSKRMELINQWPYSDPNISSLNLVN